MCRPVSQNFEKHDGTKNLIHSERCMFVLCSFGMSKRFLFRLLGKNSHLCSSRNGIALGTVLSRILKGFPVSASLLVPCTGKANSMNTAVTVNIASSNVFVSHAWWSVQISVSERMEEFAFLRVSNPSSRDKSTRKSRKNSGITHCFVYESQSVPKTSTENSALSSLSGRVSERMYLLFCFSDRELWMFSDARAVRVLVRQ